MIEVDVITECGYRVKIYSKCHKDNFKGEAHGAVFIPDRGTTNTGWTTCEWDNSGNPKRLRPGWSIPTESLRCIN